MYKIYKDLHDLLMDDDECRAYLLKLPVREQLTVHQQNDTIRTKEELWRYIDRMTKIQK
ncbi:hypothetical protein [Caproiciproducens sp. LBM24188]|nr:hypothetical protein [Clostridiales bacterium]